MTEKEKQVLETAYQMAYRLHLRDSTSVKHLYHLDKILELLINLEYTTKELVALEKSALQGE